MTILLYLVSALSSIIIGIIVSVAAFFIARHFTQVREKAEVILRFSDQFQNLLCIQHKLNIEYKYRKTEAGSFKSKPEDTGPKDKDKEDAWNFFRQYFNLLFQEFYFFDRKVLDEDIMIEWMKWRFYSFNPTRAAKECKNPVLKFDTKVCGTDFNTGWDWWKDRPVADPARSAEQGQEHKIHDFVKFMDKIKEAANDERQDESAVERIVRSFRRRRVVAFYLQSRPRR